MPKRLPSRTENLRKAVAQEAARIMAEHGVNDYLFAKRKAAERFGVLDGSVLPRNTEIEAALAEYQRLFEAETHIESLLAQRLTAVEVMQTLREFQPRLVGPVLAGTATGHDPVQIHAFADRAESVAFRLMDRGVDYEMAEKRVRVNADRVLAQPMLEFKIDAQSVEVVVFTVDGIRHSPASPVDGKPMRRADLVEVQRLIETGDTCSSDNATNWEDS